MVALLALHGSARDETDLAEFSRRIAPHARLIAPRGPFPDANGFTFFRRRPDRSIASTEVVDLAREWLSRAATLLPADTREVVLAGYSSGAIFAEALLSVAPERFAGAILLRPEPLSPGFTFPDMPGKPILVLAGRYDERRRPDDALVLATQLGAARAKVSLHVLDAGHGWAAQDADGTLARTWLASIRNR